MSAIGLRTAMKPEFYDKFSVFLKTFSIPNSFFLWKLPVFPILSSQINIFTKPEEFYNELIHQTARAKKRIILSSLYVGTGHLEQKLVSNVSERLDSEPNLRVHWLLDYTRASRGEKNSRLLLLPLLKKKCKVSLFHTPNLRGLYKRLLPQRWNEIIGLQHMKIYVYDDSVIISGANLSHDYFVNRQDRYILIKDCPELADFYEGLVSVVANHSLCLDQDNNTSSHTPALTHPFQGSCTNYCSQFTKSIKVFWNSELEKSKKRLDNIYLKFNELGNSQELDRPNTFLFTTIQMPQFGINVDSSVTLKLLQSLPQNCTVRLATGYFNLTGQYVESILRESKARFDILCAHPRANGFLGAKGFAGGIPAAYTDLVKGFYQKVITNRHTDRVKVFEFEFPGWTFHAKGLWYFPPGDATPAVMLIGSPNFGYRSVYRDLETQLLLSTVCPALRQSMAEEQQRLYTSAHPVTESTFTSQDRIVPLWVRFVTYFVKFFF